MPVLSSPLKNRLAVISTSVTTEMRIVTQELSPEDSTRIKKRKTTAKKELVTLPVELPEHTNVFAKGDLIRDECYQKWTVTDINEKGKLEIRNQLTGQIKYHEDPCKYTHVRPKNQPHTFIHTEQSSPKVPYASRKRGDARE